MFEVKVNSHMAPAAIDPKFCRVCVRLCNGIDRDEYFVYCCKGFSIGGGVCLV